MSYLNTITAKELIKAAHDAASEASDDQASTIYRAVEMYEDNELNAGVLIRAISNINFALEIEKIMTNRGLLE